MNESKIRTNAKTVIVNIIGGKSQTGTLRNKTHLKKAGMTSPKGARKKKM